MFNKTIKSVLLYGCEVWGNLKRSTPSFMINGELVITTITVDIKARLASYWSKLVENQANNLTSFMYTIIYHTHKNKSLLIKIHSKY